MKKLIFCLLLVCALKVSAQDSTPKNQASFELGSGLNFSFNEGDYQFILGGMIQPSFAFEKMKDSESDYFFNVKRSYLNFSGKAVKEKVSFFFQTDFSLKDPLLDAWVAFHPSRHFTISLGQRQSIANNREMLIMEDQLQFPDRGLVSTVFSETGREFGVFGEGRFGSDKFALVPQIAITSGDGRNSFGADSREVDLGGVKYGGRLDIFPLGFFSEGNDQLIADLAHEKKLKLVLGVAASYNDGASNAVGEGHGDFFLYNSNGGTQLPDYRQLYSDILVKFQGFSLLGEYAVSTATSLEGSYTDAAGTQPLVPTQISEYLALGTALNAQLGYVTQSGYALDFRYGVVNPEFEENMNSIVQKANAVTVGFSKYFKGNDLKLQTAFSSTNYSDNTQSIRGDLVFQLVF